MQTGKMYSKLRLPASGRDDPRLLPRRSRWHFSQAEVPFGKENRKQREEEKRRKRLSGEETEGRRQEGGEGAGWREGKRETEAEGQDTKFEGLENQYQNCSSSSASEWIFPEVTQFGSPQMSQTPGQETQARRPS